MKEKNIYNVLSLFSIGGTNMSDSHSQDVNQLWSQWKENRNEEIANDLIAHYMYIVDYHVERVASHIPASFERNDLRSLGLMGLYDALTKFDPERNLKFSTYATIRVRGSIIDGLRREDWLPRTLREQTKRIESAINTLEQTLARTPTAKEIAEEVEMDEEEVEATMSHALFANVLSLETTVSTSEDDQDTEIADMVEDDTAIHPDEQVTFNELTEELIEHMKRLNENEQLVLSLFYEKELTLTEIGEILNLTTSRISQIHKQAIFKLRETLTKLL